MLTIPNDSTTGDFQEVLDGKDLPEIFSKLIDNAPEIVRHASMTFSSFRVQNRVFFEAR
jgi:hypothetical protein